MADISLLNIGGSDYSVKDATARANSVSALTLIAYKEDNNTASQAYSVIGTPINWKGTLYYTTTAVAAGATWTVGTNLAVANNLGRLTSNIKTYVNNDGKLVFRDLTGADTVLPFNGEVDVTMTITFGSTASARPAESGEKYLSLAGTSTFTFTDTSTIRIKTYTLDGVTVSHNGDNWVFTKSVTGSGTGYAGGNWATTYGVGSATITFTYTP